MSLNYDPDDNVQVNGTWDTTFLSDRDVSSQVPINFVPHPGVYVTAACFGNGIYERGAAENCLSNLLSSQIRRYVIDLYWDTINHRFGLCPVEIPNTSKDGSQIATSEGPIAAEGTLTPSSVAARQITPTSSANVTASSTVSSAKTASAAPTYSVISSNDDTRVLQLGPYQCSDTLTLASVTSVFSDYLTRTSNTLDAKILIWVLNLHVASSLDQPTLPRTDVSPGLLPNSTQNVASYLDNLEDVLYDPGTLLSDRQNLNSSWFRRGNKDELPLTTYIDTFNNSNGDVATNDGWPDENYIQVIRGKRMLVGFGEIDSAMSEYNTSMDGGRVYAPNYISNRQTVEYQSNGQLASGCYYDASEFDVSELNNSWAVASINSVDPPDLGAAADNLTTCGFSQLLNVTIDGITADAVAGPYQTFGDNAIFSWAYGQPENDTSPGVDEDRKFRCAVMISTDAYRGHWRVEYCSEHHRVACREANAPYRWRISEFSVPYGDGDAACRGNSTFDVPRTGLENTYLYNTILNDSRNEQSLPDGIWINFNSLDYQNCWVTTGVNGTCPYPQDSSATQSRQILIPALAALIVLILTLLTILVKCTSNARNSKIRRRGEGGWDYEGVPS
ncbi:Maintenance of telomere capping protein 6 [Knufia obscura]|uniref:Maintenance of telomere capping protein 6 n=1 Tax=Knufia obscura TaxID=1635080 RepID=A0ABR0RTH2_9EURO|nr:Maintenance of telomere capping protein 6 [Knufia obscura]